MATYFHGNSEIQGGGDGLQTLILMNPAYAGYTDTQQHQLPPPGGGNFVFLGPNSAGNTINFSQAHNFTGVPTSASVASPRDSHHQDVSEFHGFLPGVHFNLHNPSVEIGEARDFTRSQQGLSLSLSSSQQPTGYGSFRPPEREAPPLVMAAPLPGREDIRVSNSMNGVQSVVLGSKYLKATQELLEEVVHVGREANNANEKINKGGTEQPNNIGESSAAGDGQSGGESIAKRGAELTTAEKHEIQMKKAKLVNILDEVEQRYKQYNNQIQIVITLFEQMAGIGSAKTYTDLALKTISKQFRCLKDSIVAQIRAATKSLGEEDHGSRLKYVDNQIRQQRALQQLGMIQQNAWRPQRGLPERSVSVLRAWLFEHFLHPYPKDSDKIMLAKQAGLTRGQVSNWFINARVRLWKPMVEEMYAEEMKEHERNEAEDNPTKTEPSQVPEMETITQRSPKKLCNFEETPNNVNNEPTMLMKFGTERQSGDGFTLMGAPTNFIGGFSSYPVGEFGPGHEFGAPYSGNGVSLTLGLPHGESDLSMSGGHQTFMPNESMQLGKGVEIREPNGFGSMIGQV